jgi:hypothetical protein
MKCSRSVCSAIIFAVSLTECRKTVSKPPIRRRPRFFKKRRGTGKEIYLSLENYQFHSVLAKAFSIISRPLPTIKIE